MLLASREHLSRVGWPPEKTRVTRRYPHTIGAVKGLFIFLLIVVCIGLFFHDKQQTADLTKAQTENAQLVDELSTSQSQLTQLQERNRQLSAQVLPQQSTVGHNSVPSRYGDSSNGLSTDHLQDPGGLDRPAYH